MGIVDRILGRTPKASVYLNADGTPKTVNVVSRGPNQLNGIAPFKRDKKILDNYWKYYQGEGTIFAAINNIAYNTVNVGYHIMSDNPEAKKLIETRFKELDVDGYLIDNMIYGLVYGDSFIEKVKATRKNELALDNPLDAYIPPSITRLKDIKKHNSKDYKYSEIKTGYEHRLKQLKALQDNKRPLPDGYIARLKTVNSPTMEAIIDNKTGEIAGYKQNINGRKTPPLKLDDIIHLGFFPQSNSPYHISLIGPSKDTIDRMVDVDTALHNATIRHGTPKFHVKVGTAEEPLPPKEVYDNITRDLEDISSKVEYITPAIIDINTVDESGVPNVEQYANLFQKKTIVGLMISEESLGTSSKSSSDASSSVREIMFERFIQALQRKIATILRTELINPLLVEAGFDENIVNMRFKSVTTRDEEGFAKWYGNLLRGFQNSPQKPVTINEIRDAFGLDPIEDGDDLSWGGTLDGDDDSDDEDDGKDGLNIQPTAD